MGAKTGGRERFVGIAAIVVDVGILLLGRARLSTALDAAVLAAPQEPPDTLALTATSNDYDSLSLPGNGLSSEPEITVGFSGVFPSTVTAKGHQTATLFFEKVLGLDDATVRVASAAEMMDRDSVLVADCSGSMCEDRQSPVYPDRRGNCPVDEPPWQPTDSTKGAAKDFVHALGNQTNMGLVSYTTNANIELGPRHLLDEELEPGCCHSAPAPDSAGVSARPIGLLNRMEGVLRVLHRAVILNNRLTSAQQM